MAQTVVPEQPPPTDREQYELLEENPFMLAAQEPLSTFSVDVDTASYANVRRMLTNGQKPPVDAVRIEELVNYFNYRYPEPAGEHPFSVPAEVAACPWQLEHGWPGSASKPAPSTGRSDHRATWSSCSTCRVR